jgi:hypothetical protein
VFRPKGNESLDEVGRYCAWRRQCSSQSRHANFLNDLLEARRQCHLHEACWRGAFDPECVRNTLGQEHVATALHNKLPITTAKTHAPFKHPEWLVLSMMNMKWRTKARRGQLFEQTECSPGVLARSLDDHKGAQKPVGVAVRSTNYS